VFAEMRRHDRQLTEEDARSIITQGIYGVLSMNGEYPYGVPLSYVYKDNSIYFHCALEGKKLVAIGKDNKASFCVVNEATPMKDAFSMRYDSAMAFGKIVEVDASEKLDILIVFIYKYAGNDDYITKGKEHALNMLQKTQVLKMEIEHISAKSRR